MTPEKVLARFHDDDPVDRTAKHLRHIKNFKNVDEYELEVLPKHDMMNRGWGWTYLKQTKLDHWLARFVGRSFDDFYSFVSKQLGRSKSKARHNFERQMRGSMNLLQSLTNPSRWDNFELDAQGKIQRHKRTKHKYTWKPHFRPVYLGDNTWKVYIDGIPYHLKFCRTTDLGPMQRLQACVPRDLQREIQAEARTHSDPYKDCMAHNRQPIRYDCGFGYFRYDELGLVSKVRIYE